MDTSTQLEQKHQSGYSLDIRVFENGPTNLQTTYEVGTVITRDNWTAMLIDSFAKARNSLPAHALYFDYIQDKTGLNYTETIDAYLNNGGSEGLTDEEQALIVEAFKRISEHTRTKDNSRLYILGQFDNYIADLSRATYAGIQHPFTEELHQMDKKILMDRLNQIIKEK